MTPRICLFLAGLSFILCVAMPVVEAAAQHYK